MSVVIVSISKTFNFYKFYSLAGFDIFVVNY